MKNESAKERKTLLWCFLKEKFGDGTLIWCKCCEFLFLFCWESEKNGFFNKYIRFKYKLIVNSPNKSSPSYYQRCLTYAKQIQVAQKSGVRKSNPSNVWQKFGIDISTFPPEYLVQAFDKSFLKVSHYQFPLN